MWEPFGQAEFLFRSHANLGQGVWHEAHAEKCDDTLLLQPPVPQPQVVRETSLDGNMTVGLFSVKRRCGGRSGDRVFVR